MTGLFSSFLLLFQPHKKLFFCLFFHQKSHTNIFLWWQNAPKKDYIFAIVLLSRKITHQPQKKFKKHLKKITKKRGRRWKKQQIDFWYSKFHLVSGSIFSCYWHFKSPPWIKKNCEPILVMIFQLFCIVMIIKEPSEKLLFFNMICQIFHLKMELDWKYQQNFFRLTSINAFIKP